MLPMARSIREIVVILSARWCGALALLAFPVLGLPAAAADNAPPTVQSPANGEISFAYFQDRLSPFGHWLRHPVWGDVWQPDAGSNFRPYFYGYWQYTSDYGWLWVSNEPYGDIVYHYGRWVYDPNYGWLWVPGYIWGPGWVAWRETDGYIGWLPMPPGYQDFSLSNLTPSYTPAERYGYQYFYGSNFAPDAFASLWLFVPNQDFGRSDRRRYIFDKDRTGDLYRRSHDRTHYEHDRDRDRIVDRSIDRDELERSTHRSFGAQQGRQFLRRDTPVTSVTQGQEIARRDRDRDPARGPAGGLGPLPGSGPGTPPERFGRGFEGFPRRDGPPPGAGQSGVPPQAGPGAAAVNPRARAPGEFRARDSGRAFPGRNPPAAPGAAGLAPPANIPSTEVLRGAQSPALPRSVPQAAQQPGAAAGIVTPDLPRTRGTAFRAVPPSVPLPAIGVAAPPPVIGGAPGLQPGLQSGRRAPVLQTAPAVPIVPQAASGPAPPVPQASPPAQHYQGAQTGRGGRRLPDVPGSQ